MQCAGIQMSSAQIVAFSKITDIFVFFIAVTLSADMTAKWMTMHIVESRVCFSDQKKTVLLSPGVLGTNYSFTTLASTNDSCTFHQFSFPTQPVWLKSSMFLSFFFFFF